MRKIFTAILAAVLLLFLPVCAYAADSFIYEDTAGGNQLILPAGWDLEFEDNTTTKVIFVPQEEVTEQMQYRSIDFWKSLGAESKRKTPRSAMDNSHFSAADVAELVGCSAKDVKRITLGGTEYYRAVFEKQLPSGRFSFTVHLTYWVRYHNGWIYIYQYVGSPASPTYTQFKNMISNAVYTAASENALDTDAETASDSDQKPANDEDTYTDAVKAYESGDYPAAQELFSAVPEYEDSTKYLRLLRIRNAGSNKTMGSLDYQKELGLTEENKQDVADAAEDFSFADTAQVLLCNSDVASYYLTGLWSGGVHTYLHFTSDDSGGAYRIGSKLSEVKYNIYAIENGDFHVYAAKEDILLLKLTLTDPNTLEVVTYAQDNQVYTLKRK